MDVFPKMFQKTFVIVEQQVKHIEGVIKSSTEVQLVKVSLFYSMKGNFNNGIRIIDVEPTTDGKIGLEDDSLC